MDENLNETNVTENVEPQNVAPVEPAVQNVTPTENVEMGNDNGGNKKDPASIGFVVLILALFALFVAGGFLIAGSLKSDGKIVEALKDDYMFEMHNEMSALMSEEGKHTVKYKIDILSLLSALNYDDVKVENISFENTLLKKGEDASGRFSFIYGDDSLVDLDYAKTGDLYGANVPGLFEKFIAIENNNLKALAEKYDIDSGEIPNKITEEELLKMADTEELEKYEKVFDPYFDILSDNLKDNTVTTKNESITINGTELKTVKHSALYCEKDAALLIFDLFEEAYDDKDLYELLVAEDESLSDLTFEDYQETISGEIADFDEVVGEMSTEEIYEFAVYVKGSDTVAIEFKENKTNVVVRVAGINESKKSYIEVVGEVPEESMTMKLVVNTVKDGTSYKGDMALAMDVAGAVSVNIGLMEYEYVYEKNTQDELLVVNTNNSLILNTASEEDLTAWAQEISNNSETYLNAMKAKVPEEVVEAVAGMIEDMMYPAYDYDYDDSYDWEDDYDYNYDDEYDYDWDSDYTTTFESEIQILSDLQNKYNQVEVGMSKADVLSKLGEEDAKDTYGSSEYLDWNSSADDYSYVTVVIEDGVVYSKTINASSSSWDGIALSKELNTSIADLEAKIDSVEDGMTLTEVKAVLGNACFESRASEYGTTYTWYDTAENYVEIDFDENNRVDYVGSVWGSY